MKPLLLIPGVNGARIRSIFRCSVAEIPFARSYWRQWRQHDRIGSVSSVLEIQVLCRVAIQSRRIVRTSACSTSPESLARSVHAIKPAGVTTIAVRISIMNTDIIIPGRPTHVHLIFWGRVVLACPADVVVSTSIAIWISVPCPRTLRRIAAFEAEGCAGQRILRRKWEGED
jgi:hypothetical protein